MWNRETWEFVNSFAAWFSAVGTLAAVIVSLYLATRDWRVRLRVGATLGQPIMSGKVDPQPFIFVTAANYGRRRAIIVSLTVVRRLSRKRFAMIPSDHPLSARLPLALDDGESGVFVFPVTDRNIEAFDRLVGRLPAWAGVRMVRLVAKTAIDEAFVGRLAKSLQASLRAALDERRAHPNE